MSMNCPFKNNLLFPAVLEGGIRFHRDVTRKRGMGGGALQKMASLRCRRDPCGVICLILTYFSVFYADYVVIQYVLIPAYSGRSVFCVFMSFKPLEMRHGVCFPALSPFIWQVSQHPHALSLCWIKTQLIFTFSNTHLIGCLFSVFVSTRYTNIWHQITSFFLCLLAEAFDPRQNSRSAVWLLWQTK